MSDDPDFIQDQKLRALMSAAQDGEHAAYDLLLRMIIPVIRRFLTSRTKAISGPDLEDIVQDVLLSLHQARATYDPNRPFLPWLFAIARNRLTDRGRRQARLWKNEIGVERLPETFLDPEANKLSDVYRDPEALRVSMADLPEGQRVALDLMKIRGLSVTEASQQSGMSSIALRVAVHRAIKTLRSKLTKSK
jgi:RNA polymerase sigma factor (sigma-70 family)